MSGPVGATLDHVGLTCTDLTTSIHFYHNLLGMPEIDRGEGPGRAAGIRGARVAFAMLDAGGGHQLELIQYLIPRSESTARKVQEPGAVHVALRVDRLDPVLERASQAGFRPLTDAPITITDPADGLTSRLVYLTDPDRHVVELIEHDSLAAGARSRRSKPSGFRLLAWYRRTAGIRPQKVVDEPDYTASLAAPRRPAGATGRRQSGRPGVRRSPRRWSAVGRVGPT